MTNILSVEELKGMLRQGDTQFVSDYISRRELSSVDYQACLCDAFFQGRNWSQALKIALNNLGASRYFDELLIAKIYSNNGDTNNALGWLKKYSDKKGQDFQFLQLLSKIMVRIKDFKAAAFAGQQVLAIKNQQYTRKQTPADFNTGRKKIVAFSLWGDNDAYLYGALINLIQWKMKLPDWTVRFYVESSVPQDIVRQLKMMGAEVVSHDDHAIPGYFKRFLLLEEEDCERFLCRDTDCRLTDREVELIRVWERSGKAFHVIRNHLLHTDLVLAGLWGGRPIKSFNLAQQIEKYFNGKPSNKYGHDQMFLERVLWPTISLSVYQHDQHFSFGGYAVARVNDDSIGLGHQVGAEAKQEYTNLLKSVTYIKKPAN